MSDPDVQPTVEHPEVVDGPPRGEAEQGPVEVIEQPAKIMRIGTMIRALLEEARSAELDERGRDRLRDIYDTSIRELSSTLSGDLQGELNRLAHPFSGEGPAPSGSELRVAQAQLVGWLEGLFQGIQATMFAQQMAARQQLESMRGQLPQGSGGMMPGGPGRGDPRDGRPGTYL